MFRFLIIVLLTFSSCQFFDKGDETVQKSEENYFYTSKKVEDQWRIPLLNPYEMVSPLGPDEYNWFLIVNNPKITGPEFQKFDTEFQFSGIYQAGISDSIIRLDNENEHWPKLGGSFPTTLLINAKTQELYIARTEEDKKAIDAQLKAWKAENMKMYFWYDVRDDYQKHGKLPPGWRGIKN